MGEALLEMYNTMTVVEKQELFDFAMFIISKKDKKTILTEEDSLKRMRDTSISTVWEYLKDDTWWYLYDGFWDSI